MELQQIIEGFKQIEEGFLQYSNISLNKKVLLQDTCEKKNVFYDDKLNKIIKVWYTRAFSKYYAFIGNCISSGIYFFEPEQIEYRGPIFTITSQRKLQFLDQAIEPYEYFSLPEWKNLEEIIQYFQILDLYRINMGIDEQGQIHCFDFEILSHGSIGEIQDFFLSLNKGKKEVPLMSISELYESLNKIKEGAKFFKEHKSLNGVPFQFGCRAKYLIEGSNNKIYRIDDPLQTIQRLLLYKYFEDQGLHGILLKETLLPDFKPEDGFLITEQRKIEVMPMTIEEIDIKIRQQLGDKKFKQFQEIKENIRLNWYGNGNAGLLNGEVRIFDYVVNLAVSQKGENLYYLKDRNGGSLVEGKF